MKHTKILLTGFEPFAHYAENPSGMAALSIGTAYPESVTVQVLPVDHVKARDTLLATLETVRPELCLSMGQAPNPHFLFETQARKPEVYAGFSGANVYEVPAETQQAFDPAAIKMQTSRDAGQYVCESVLWTLLDHQSRTDYLRHAMFIHVPAISEQWPSARTTQYLLDWVLPRCWQMV